MKFTNKVAAPLVGAPVKPAIGAIAAEPVSTLVETPPLLANATEPVNAPTATGLKLTLTSPVCALFTVYELPLTRAKGAPDTVTVPVSACIPALTTKNVWLLLWPTGRNPKSRLPGATTRCGGPFVTTI